MAHLAHSLKSQVKRHPPSTAVHGLFCTALQKLSHSELGLSISVLVYWLKLLVF